MRTWKILAIAILAIAAIALTSTTVFAFMGRPGYYAPYITSPGTTGTTGTYVTSPSGTPTYGGYNRGYGGMMGGGWGCGGMSGRFGYRAPIYASPTAATQLNISTAVVIAQNYVMSTGNSPKGVTS